MYVYLFETATSFLKTQRSDVKIQILQYYT